MTSKIEEAVKGWSRAFRRLRETEESLVRLSTSIHATEARFRLYAADYLYAKEEMVEMDAALRSLTMADG